MRLFYALVVVCTATTILYAKHHDVNVVGLIGTETTSPLVSTIITDILKDRFSVNFLRSRTMPGGVIQSAFKQDIPFDLSLISIEHHDVAPISLLTDVIGYKNKLFYRKVPSTTLKIAYSMFEATHLPSMWVNAINQSFDMIVVPDQALISIYKQSGVKKPIFVIPLPVYLEKLLAQNNSSFSQRPDPFVFGISAGFSPRKNHETLLTAFAQEFGNNPHVLLKVHGSWGTDKKKLQNHIKKLGMHTIKFIDTVFSREEYINYLSSIHTYVYPSAGEGYSLTPREILALSKPCILANHTVHTSIIHVPGIVEVPALQRVRAYFPEFKEYCGYFHYCTVNDLRKALRAAYTNYSTYKEQAAHGREWAKQFLRSALAPLFYTLISPQTIELGKTNTITPEKIVTTSKSLYRKYCSIYPILASSKTLTR